ncbi:MAG: hypothetical protein JW839_00540, partial [Candidatus Lokiarchaeota archaeon]|nr:hypothetical protein [Candidatus Lokiarchaeota archaeon]
MPFKTLFIRDAERNIFDWTTKMTDGDVVFIIDSDRAVIYVVNGSRTSMMKKYEAGVIAPKLKSVLQLYAYKIEVVDQGEGPAELKAEVERLLQGEGTPISPEEGDGLASAVESLTSVRPGGDAELAGGEKAAAAGVAARADGYKAKKEAAQAEAAAMKEEYEKRIGELQSANERLQAENEAARNELDALKRDAGEKTRYLELEKEKVRLEAESARKDLEGAAAGLEAKIRYLELEREKLGGDIEASRGELASTRARYEEKVQALQSANDALKQDQATAESELDAARKECEALKSDTEQRIRKIKEEHAEKVKLNFFNMKALPSAPSGTVWFESIVQVVAGDKAIFTKDVDTEKLKDASKAIEKPKAVAAAAAALAAKVASEAREQEA